MPEDFKEQYHHFKKKYLNLKKKLQLRQQRQSGGATTSNFPLIDEIHFWGRQLTEHCLFLFLGLQDTDNILKTEAYELNQRWEKFMNETFYDKGIKVTPETVFLSESDLDKVGNISTDKVNKLIDATIDFKSKLVEILDHGIWIGWNFISLVKHMLQESLYFRKKVNGPAFTRDEEIQYANHHHSTEMGVTAQLIDPQIEQQPLIDVIRSYALKRMSELKLTGSLTGTDSAMPFPKRWTKEEEAILQGLEPNEKEQMLFLSIRFGEELVKFAEDTGIKVDNGQLRSLISSTLAHHVHREFVRFTENLKKFG